MSSLRHVEQCISRQLAHQHLNAYVTAPTAAKLRPVAQALDAAPTQPLHGRLISLKDNIASLKSSSEPTTCSSQALEGYTSPISSTVAELLHKAGAIVAGKTNMDEFGMGSHSQSPFSGTVQSHLHPAGSSSPLSAGGSSGGSAIAVATGQCWAALGTDTGGSVRLPAAWTGTVGFKPTYGRISRYGVVDYANSLDTVGIISTSVRNTRSVFHVLDKHDPKDPTSLSSRTRSRFTPLSTSNSSRLRIGVPKEYNVSGLHPSVRSAWTRTLSLLQDQGHSLVPVSLPSTPLALSAYYILAPAEASSNLARYDGVEYGFRSKGPDAVVLKDKDQAKGQESVLYAKTRGQAFGAEVRRRILLGTYTLSSGAFGNYFLQAQKVRRLVRGEFDGVFAAVNTLVRSSREVERNTQGGSEREVGQEKVDVLIAPTAPTLPPTLDEVERQTAVERYLGDVLTVPASLAGLPVVSVPVPLEGEFGEGEVSTAGMQVMGQVGDDEQVLGVGEVVE
ncbi:DNA polymerase IV, partial [Elsinoe ampelina]